MNFARAQLEKYGWKDGDGLGKSKNGIAEPVKAKLKFDKSGMGHNISDELINPWWQRVYDSAAKNVKVEKTGDEVKVKRDGEEVEITTKRKKKRKKQEEELGNPYGNFIKKSFLTWEGEKTVGGDKFEEEDEEPRDKKKRSSGILDLTDEELFKACGGRTAHKGARHGLSMSAKLARVENQETTTEVDPPAKKKKKKKRKHNSDQ